MRPAILFDLDGTLLDRDTSLKRFLTEQYARFGDILQNIDRDIYIQTVVRLDGYGHVPKPQTYAQAGKIFALPEGSEKLLLADFESHFHVCAVPFHGLSELLYGLVARNWQLGLVTNGKTRVQQPKIDALGIRSFFGTILVSEEQGIRKPDPEIYLRAVQNLQVSPESTIFIGDHPEADIAGARNAGLRTIWKRNTCWPAPKEVDAEINQLSEILPIVDSWLPISI
jgi:putative hydrolase of the HAD superfamily